MAQRLTHFYRPPPAVLRTVALVCLRHSLGTDVARHIAAHLLTKADSENWPLKVALRDDPDHLRPRLYRSLRLAYALPATHEQTHVRLSLPGAVLKTLARHLGSLGDAASNFGDLINPVLGLDLREASQPLGAPAGAVSGEGSTVKVTTIRMVARIRGTSWGYAEDSYWSGNVKAGVTYRYLGEALPSQPTVRWPDGWQGERSLKVWLDLDEEESFYGVSLAAQPCKRACLLGAEMFVPLDPSCMYVSPSTSHAAMRMPLSEAGTLLASARVHPESMFNMN